MKFQQKHELDEYLKESKYIDVTHPKTQIIATYCLERAKSAMERGDKDAYGDAEAEVCRQCYLLVRDEIKHSHDINSDKVTFKASDVLSAKEGICFAKANLLCALLRANGIPAGIGYQYLRLIENDENSPLILHAFNFVCLESAGGWVRLDARGNRGLEIRAEFSLEKEKMAFVTDPGLGEIDLPFIFASHDRAVVAKFLMHDNLTDLWKDLPDKLSGLE